jgi:aldehyde oxidoreductase
VNQSNFAMESMLDELCALGGFDRWQFRYDNALDEGLPTTTGQKYGQGARA